MTHTKKALMMSIFSMVLCMAMLMGTTFAWFTDTAGTAVNIVKSGDLELDIVKINGDEDGSSILNSNTQQIAFEANGSEPVTWNSNSEFMTEGFKIKNTGKLAFKYKLMVNVEGVDKVLRENMTFTILEGTEEKGKVAEGRLIAESDTSSDVVTQDDDVKAESESNVYYIKGKMKQGADDDCQGRKLAGIRITVIATQDNVESDSNGNSYDSEAAFEVEDKETFRNSLESGGVIQLANDIAIEPEVLAAEKGVSSLVPQMTVTKDTTLDLSKYKLSVMETNANYGKASPVLIAVTEGTLTINGDGEINCEAGNNQVYGINVNGGSVVINGGKFYGALTSVQVQKGMLEINGGFFDMAPTCKEQVPHYAKYVVNAIDANYKEDTARISIKGGTFVNFDPSDNPEGEGTSYVADGYKVVRGIHGSEIWYTVVKNE